MSTAPSAETSNTMHRAHRTLRSVWISQDKRKRNLINDVPLRFPSHQGQQFATVTRNMFREIQTGV